MHFSVNKNYHGVNLIYGSGKIYRGDLRRLSNSYRYLSRSRQTILVLNSGGGELSEGIKIGKFLKENHIGTAVKKYGECASSCALAFLGGRSLDGSKLLILPRGSKLGYHNFYYKHRSYVNPSQVQRDLSTLMNYTRYVNAPSELVSKMLDTDSSHMYWISNYERNKYRLRIGYNRISFRNHKGTVNEYARGSIPRSSSSSKYLLTQTSYVRYYFSKINTLISAYQGASFNNTVAYNDIYNKDWLSNNLKYVFIKNLKLKKANRVEAKVIYALKNGKRICSLNRYNLYQNNNGWSIVSKSHKACNHSSQKIIRKFASLLP